LFVVDLFGTKLTSQPFFKLFLLSF